MHNRTTKNAMYLNNTEYNHWKPTIGSISLSCRQKSKTRTTKEYLDMFCRQTNFFKSRRWILKKIYVLTVSPFFSFSVIYPERNVKSEESENHVRSPSSPTNQGRSSSPFCHVLLSFIIVLLHVVWKRWSCLFIVYELASFHCLGCYERKLVYLQLI